MCLTYLHAGFTDKWQTALFLCRISLAATWDRKLLYEVGEHLAQLELHMSSWPRLFVFIAGLSAGVTLSPSPRIRS
jgi:hypothetical protein